MTGNPFVYLTLCTFRNRWRLRLRRLREPRYLIGLIAGITYFYFMLLRRDRGPRGGVRALLPWLEHNLETAVIGASLVLFALAALAWFLPAGKGLLFGITPSEVQFLVPAPLPRRRVIRFQVLRSQLGVLFGSAFFTLLFHPTSWRYGLTLFVGVTGVLMLVSLYAMTLSATRASLAQPRSPAPRWLPFAIAGGALALVAGSFALAWTRRGLPGSFRDALTSMGQVGSTSLAGLILAPFRAVARLPLSTSPVALARALPAAAVLWAINYLWILRTDVPLGETRADAPPVPRHLDDAGQTVTPAKPRATPFRLAHTGRPELAIAWKNLVPFGRGFSTGALMKFAFPLLVIGFLSSRRGFSSSGWLVATFSLVAAGFTIVMGPQVMRNDLRRDLAHLATLKTWPVRGAMIVRGELLGPTAVLTGAAWLFLAVAAAVAIGSPVDLGGPPGVTMTAAVLAAMVLTPGLILLQLVLHNGLALMFPAWVRVTPSRAAGVDVMGQRLVMVYGVVFALLIALIPAAVAVAVAGLAIRWLTSSVPLVLLAFVALLVVLAEAVAAIELLGGRFDRMDVSAIDSTG